MALKPEDIESKTFAQGLRGYDKDEVNRFLSEVANEYRWVLAGQGENGISDEADEATEWQDDGDNWSKMGEQVAAVLRTAKEQAVTITTQAGEEVAELQRTAKAEADLAKLEAEKYSTDLMTNAESYSESRQREADADREEARRMLASHEDDALALVTDARARAEEIVGSTEREAQERAGEVLAEAQIRLNRLIESERSTQARLVEAREYLDAALQTFAGEEHGTLDGQNEPDEANNGAVPVDASSTNGD